jgi:uncharacterized protein YdhG (YjbR/CyaY superfamily)
MNSDKIPQTIDEYIEVFPENVQEKLNEMRQTIRNAAPEAIEKISYRMPSYAFKGMLVYFAAHKNHLGFYPFTSAIRAFSSELAPYQTSKGGIQFPYKNPLPINLIQRIIDFRVKENFDKAALKKIRISSASGQGSGRRISQSENKAGI